MKQNKKRSRAAPALFWLALLLLFCFLGPLIWPTDPAALDLAAPLAPPALAHPMGTDELGRDTLARLMQGGRATLAVAIPATLAALAVALAYGLAAGLAPPWADAVLMRVLDAALALPSLVVLLAAAALVPDAGPPVIALLIAAIAWPAPARIIRHETLARRQALYVLAARQMGAGPLAVARTHLLPAMSGVLAVNAAFLFGDAILALSSLSFLGLGIQPPAATWGSLLAAGLPFMDLGAWWLVVPQAALIAASVALAASRRAP